MWYCLYLHKRSCVKIKVGQYQGGIVLGINKLEDRSVSRTSTSCTSQSIADWHRESLNNNFNFSCYFLTAVRFQRETAVARRICEAIPNVNKDNNQVIYD